MFDSQNDHTQLSILSIGLIALLIDRFISVRIEHFLAFKIFSTNWTRQDFVSSFTEDKSVVWDCGH